MKKYLIKTKRLGLRFITKDDIEYLKILDKDPEVKEFFPEGTLRNAEIAEFIESSVENLEKNHLPCFVIFRLNPKAFLGEAYFDELATGEIKVGYLLHKKFWNKGYATEALTALLEWAKKNIEADYIVSYADINNLGSFRVMEKCGMKHYKEGTFLKMKCHFYRIKNK